MSIKIMDSIVDAHIHVWTSDFERYPLARGFVKEDLWLPCFTPEDYFEYSRQMGKVRINLVQMTWYGLDHGYILDLIAGNPKTFVGTGVVPAVSDVALPDAGKTMVSLSEGGIYAFRIRGGQSREEFGDISRWLDYPGYEKMFVTAAMHNLALSFLMSVDDLPALDQMCARHPEAPVILDHVCGVRIRNGIFPQDQLEKLCSMARHKRVMVKLGPFQALGNGNPPYLELLALVDKDVRQQGGLLFMPLFMMR